MPVKKLADALSAVNWNENVQSFLDDASAAAIAEANFRLAVWARQLESTEKGNPALAFMREAQASGHNVAALSSLALYKAAAGSIRTFAETCLYYSYFRCHLSELGTLARRTGYYISKSEIIDYHKRHTVGFQEKQQALGWISEFERWYSEISAIVHGQVPGVWIDHVSIKDISYNHNSLQVVAKEFTRGTQLMHHFFLCTVEQALWSSFSHASKKILLAGLSGKAKTTLGLDQA